LGRGYVMCHLSHAYETGASLYFTFFGAQDLRDPFEQWDRVKKEVTDQIMNGGATLTHHHGIGRVHRPWLEGEIGVRGLDGLQAMKRALDPAGIMNPGVLWRPS
jgi:alkyldihydroxyacetonephosphate synthase